MVKTGVVAAIL